MATRYNNAATVSDYHGKGAEVLSQFTFHASGTGIHYFIPEVDILLRSMKVHREGAGVAATLALNTYASGSGTAVNTLSAVTLTAAVAPRRVVIDLLEDRIIPVPQGSIVTVVLGGTATAVTVALGWMPNMFSIDGNFRSYGGVA